MQEQLALIEEPAPEWGLDPRTRDVGRKGVKQARRALEEAKPPKAA